MADLGPALAGIGQGVNQSLGNLQAAARDTRNEARDERAIAMNKPMYDAQVAQANEQQAISEDSLRKLQERRIEIPKSEIRNSSPSSAWALKYLEDTGQVDPRSDKIQKGEFQDKMSLYAKDTVYSSAMLKHLQEGFTVSDKAYTDKFTYLKGTQDDLATAQTKLDKLKSKVGALTIDEQDEKTKLEDSVKKISGKVLTNQAELDKISKDRLQWMNKESTMQGVYAGNIISKMKDGPEKLAAQSLAEAGKPLTADGISAKMKEMSAKIETTQHVIASDKSSSTGLRVMLFDPATGNFTKKGPEAPKNSNSADAIYERELAKGTAKDKLAVKRAFPKVRDANVSLNQQWEFLDKQIDKAVQEVGPFTAGAGAWMSVVPATPQKNLKELLQTIKANIGFDKLQEMRQNSPTGGALGQVSDMENKLLQSVRGSLDQSQSSEQLIENLNNIKNTLNKLRVYKDNAFAEDFKDYVKGAHVNTDQSDPILQLKEHAKKGDAKAQSYLKSKGISWQQ